MEGAHDVASFSGAFSHLLLDPAIRLEIAPVACLHASLLVTPSFLPNHRPLHSEN